MQSLKDIKHVIVFIIMLLLISELDNPSAISSSSEKQFCKHSSSCSQNTFFMDFDSFEYGSGKKQRKDKLV